MWVLQPVPASSLVIAQLRCCTVKPQPELELAYQLPIASMKKINSIITGWDYYLSVSHINPLPSMYTMCMNMEGRDSCFSDVETKFTEISSQLQLSRQFYQEGQTNQFLSSCQQWLHPWLPSLMNANCASTKVAHEHKMQLISCCEQNDF